MDELSLAVVGIDHPNANGGNRRFELLQCTPGEPIELRPEPRNRADPNAVAVFSARDQQIGYLAAERAPWIGRRLRAGEELAAIFQGVAGPVAYVRVRFGGGQPALPAERVSARPVPDDGVDPEGPIWGA